MAIDNPARMAGLYIRRLTVQFNGPDDFVQAVLETKGALVNAVVEGKALAADLSGSVLDELERALREHGISSYHEVALAVLEVDGSISCLKYDELNPGTLEHPVRRKYLQKKE